MFKRTTVYEEGWMAAGETFLTIKGSEFLITLKKKDNRSFLTNMILLMSLQTNANKINDFFTNITVKN